MENLCIYLVEEIPQHHVPMTDIELEAHMTLFAWAELFFIQEERELEYQRREDRLVKIELRRQRIQQDFDMIENLRNDGGLYHIISMRNVNIPNAERNIIQRIMEDDQFIRCGTLWIRQSEGTNFSFHRFEAEFRRENLLTFTAHYISVFTTDIHHGILGILPKLKIKN